MTGNTFAALDRLDARKFTALVIDIGMPRGCPSGVSLARMARLRDTDCRIVFVTGYADLAQHAEAFGAECFVKPVDFDAVAAEIERPVAV